MLNLSRINPATGIFGLACLGVAVFLAVMSYNVNRPLAGTPCPTRGTAEMADSPIQFTTGHAWRDGPTNGISVHGDITKDHPHCIQVLVWARCTVTGPTMLRVVNEHGVRHYFDIPAGREATIRAGGAPTECVTAPAAAPSL